MARYYNLPFNFEALLSRANRESYTCSLTESIGQNISLIISTKMNEFRYDPAYGCKVWTYDFVIPANIYIWKEEIKEALEEAILKYEYRIEEVLSFNIKVNKDPKFKQGAAQILDFEIKGSIKGTKKEFEYANTLFFSPYSR